MQTYRTKEKQQEILALGKQYCSKCDQLLPLSSFHKAKNTWTGVHTVCKACRCRHRRDEYDSPTVEKNRQRLARLKWLRKNKMWFCHKCGETKHMHQFSRSGVHKDGTAIYGYCKLCVAKNTNEYWKALDPQERQRRTRVRNAKQASKHYALRKAIVVDAPETYEYLKLLESDPCVYCGAPFEHVDHIVPVAQKGRTEWANLTSACAHCNCTKNAKSLLFFLWDRLDTA